MMLVGEIKMVRERDNMKGEDDDEASKKLVAIVLSSRLPTFVLGHP